MHSLLWHTFGRPNKGCGREEPQSTLILITRCGMTGAHYNSGTGRLRFSSLIQARAGRMYEQIRRETALCSAISASTSRVSSLPLRTITSPLMIDRSTCKNVLSRTEIVRHFMCLMLSTFSHCVAADLSTLLDLATHIQLAACTSYQWEY